MRTRSTAPPRERTAPRGRRTPWCLVLCAPALAAQPLEDVVVTAGRIEQRSFDAPAAIQSVGEQAIREAGPQVNLSESLNRCPGW